MADVNIANYFDEGVKLGVNPKLFANWIITDIQAVLNKEEIEITEFKIRPVHMVELINLIETKQISNKQAREIFAKMLVEPISPKEILVKNGLTLINDEKELKEIVNEILNSNEQSIKDYQNGKDKVLGYLVGLVIKKTEGKANPELTNKIVLEELKRR